MMAIFFRQKEREGARGKEEERVKLIKLIENRVYAPERKRLRFRLLVPKAETREAGRRRKTFPFLLLLLGSTFACHLKDLR